MGAFQDLTGQRYGRLLVVGPHVREKRRTKWACRCDCGNSVQVNASSLRRRLTISCGCFRHEVTEARTATHLMARRGRARAPEYVTWSHMKRRCTDPKNNSYARYGGRGITVCQPWLGSFEAFFADMGPRPTSDHQIERIDNDGNYEPGNCRWATRIEQCNNRRRQRIIEFNGERLTLAEWSRRTGIGYHTIHQRIKGGWSVEDALTTPLLRRGNRS